MASNGEEFTENGLSPDTSGTGHSCNSVNSDAVVLLVSFGVMYDLFEERLTQLSKNTSEIILFCAFNGEGNELSEVPPDVTIVPLTNNRDTRLFPIYPLVFLFHFLYWRYIMRKDFDVIHSIDYFVGPICAVSGALLSGIGSVISVRGLPKELTTEYRVEARNNRDILPFLLSYVLMIYYIVICYFVDELIFKSESESQFVEDLCWFDINHKSHIIPTGVNIDQFVPSKVTVESSSLITDLFDPAFRNEFAGKELVLYAGRLVKSKGVLSLAKHHSALECQDTHLLIVGAPPHRDHDEFMRELESVVQESSNIHLHPEYIAHDYISELIDIASAVALLPSCENEGAPKILQESLVMNTPCIAADINGIKETFHDISGCLLIDPNDKSQYKRAVEHILRDRITVDIELARSRFNLVANYQKVAEVYPRSVG
ncbi:glycosyltransferase [Salinigranum marinum]|uniref:glycosyltransferase family 4 protein n=1 Tax=Salinigranum marinum TaxID=1515595 RepID=UPI002989E9DE|nr:glycosyltransferase [Salinigranum marinum]